MSGPLDLSTMQQDYEIEDEDAYEGPDAYVEGDEIMVDAEQIDDVDPEFAAAPPENSVQGILQCEYKSYKYAEIQPYLYISSTT